MASITKLLRRQPQTSEAELEYVRERTVARLSGLSGETDAATATAVAPTIELDTPVEAVAAPVLEAPVDDPEPVAIVEPEAEAPVDDPEPVAAPVQPEAPTIEPEAVETVIDAPAPLDEPERGDRGARGGDRGPCRRARGGAGDGARASRGRRTRGGGRGHRRAPPVVEPEPEAVAMVERDPVVVVEPEAVAEPEAAVETKPSSKRSRRWWSSTKPEIVESESEPVVEAVAADAEPEPVIAEAEPAPEAVAEPEAVVVQPEPEPEAVAEPEPEPEAVAEPSPEPVVEPIAIPVIAERTVDIRHESIWEAKPAVSEPAPAPRPARPPRPRPVAKPAAVAVAPAPGSAFCPYCALSLVPAPTATRRCPRCRQRIIVKHVQGHVVFLTEASVAVFDAERQRAVDGVRWAKERTHWLKLAAAVGAAPEKVAKLERARLTEAAVTSSRQLYMSTAERAFRAAKRDDRWEVASRVRREQAAALHKAAGSPIPPPDDALALHREAVAVELRGINKMAKSVQLVGTNCCPACEADDGRTFRIATEMRETRLPHADCPKGLCRCHWDLVVRDEAMVRRYLQRKDRGSRGKRAAVDPAVPSGE